VNRQGLVRMRGLFVALLLLVACDPAPPPHNRNDSDGQFRAAVIINCDNSCDYVSQHIQLSGGRVRQRYRNVPALSAEIDPNTLASLSALVGKSAILRDRILANPRPAERYALSPAQSRDANLIDLNRFNTLGASNVTPTNFSYNNVLTGAATAHQNGIRGQDVIVAVIDSGVANNPEVVPVLADTVIGGENFVDDPEEPSATSTLNDHHGTWVSTMIAGHGGIMLPPDTELAQAVKRYAPESIIPVDTTNSVIPMFGTAPDAKIYALKTFPANGDGTPSSVVIGAMDRVLTLKTNFLNGKPSEPIAGDGSEDRPFVYDSLDIKVVNMSLGGPTLFAGREIDDILTEKLLAVGVVVVTAAGNEGYAAITGASPGTGIGSIAVGAANPPKHERILRDMQNGPGNGADFRPTDHIQIASFSSRGPTADGRPGIDIVANGFASFVQGPDGHVSMVSGTSLSSPTIAGAAALLSGAYPELSAEQIRIALIEGSNPDLIGGRPGMNDQGQGFVDIQNSIAMIEAGTLPSLLPTQPYAAPNTLIREILTSNGYPVIRFTRADNYRARIILEPGEVKQFFLEIEPDVHDVTLNIETITPELPAAKQNVLFGDDLMVTFVDSPTSVDDTRLREFLSNPSEFNIAHPQPGVVRLAFMGDWTNIGNISADFSITLNREARPEPVVTGVLVDKQQDEYIFTVTPEMTQIVLDLSWAADWRFYPSHDLDLILFDPNGEINIDGATLAAPEIVFIENPIPGEWKLKVEGYLLHDMQDEYMISSQDQDGQPIAITPVGSVPATPPADPAPAPLNRPGSR